MQNSLRIVFLAALVLAAAPAFVRADSETDKARAVADKNKDSVVWVTTSIKLTSKGDSEDHKVQALGTVLNDQGLIVSSLSTLDPTSKIAQDEGNHEEGAEAEKDKTTVQLLGAKITLPDGSEVPAEILLKDESLDLIFVRPAADKPHGKFSPITLGKNPTVRVLDRIVCLGRMNKQLDLAPTAATEEILGIVTKPRTYYLGGVEDGSPVFNLDGVFVGLVVSHDIKESEDISSISTGALTNSNSVILPAEDIAKAAQEAATHKPQPPVQPAGPTTQPAK